MTIVKKVAISALLLSFIGLNGCSINSLVPEYPPEQVESFVKQATEYNQERSYAWNVAKVMGIQNGLPHALFQSRRDITGSDVAKSVTVANIFGGPLLWGDALQNVIGSMLPANLMNPMMQPMHLVYMPRTGDVKHNDYDYYNEFYRIMRDTYAKALAEMGFVKKVDEGRMTITLAMVNEDGKPGREAEIDFFFEHSRLIIDNFPTTIPAWISKNQEPVVAMGAYPGIWRTTEDIEFDGAENGPDARDLKIELLDRFAKHLPDYSFIYVPPLQDSHGNVHQPYIADNKQKYLFDIEKIRQDVIKAQKAAKEKKS